MCTCGDCGEKYSVDIIVSDDLWEDIKPKKSGGLLCPACIGMRLEACCGYAYYFLVKNK